MKLDILCSGETKDLQQVLISVNQTKMVQMAYEMTRLAKKVANETEFQQEKQYKIFKAKQNDHHRQLKHLADELFSLSFHEECIYWLHKVFEELRISDKKERHSVLKTLCFSYFNLKKYEKAIEYGQKSLDIGLKIPLSHTINTLVAMRISASNLKRYQDASKYAKEMLKLNIVRCNEKIIPRSSLLVSYVTLIDQQMKEGNIRGAKKTIKNLKVFNLNSIDPNDVLVSMNPEWYETLLPRTASVNQDGQRYLDHLAVNHTTYCMIETIDKDRDQSVAHFCDKNFSNVEDLKEWIYNVQLYHSAGKICWMKFLIYKRFDSKQNCEKWGLLYMNMLLNILIHMNILVKEKANEDFEKMQGMGIIPYEDYIFEFINCSLRLANDVPYDDCQGIFKQLCTCLLTSRSNRSPTNFLVEAIRKYPIDVMQEAMPFIQYFIKTCFKLEKYHKNASEAANSAEHQATYQKRKEEMISLKNSLMIMNHFKTFSIRYTDEL